MPHRPLFTLLLGALLAAGLSCREENGGGSSGGAILGTPTVFIPAGILRSPSGIAVDSRGDVWISDTFNNTIRRFASSGAQVQTFPGYASPGGMGVDRTTGGILALVAGSSLLRIDPSTGSATVFAVLNAQSVDTTAVYDLFRRSIGRRLMLPSGFGDVDGSTGAAVYVSVLANGNENFVVEVRGGLSKAVAHSSQRMPVELGPAAQFMACNELGDVYSAFYSPVSAGSSTHRAFALYPSSIQLSSQMNAVQVSGAVVGGCYDPAGYLMLADAAGRQVIAVSVASERIVERHPLPEIAGLVRPVPVDAAVAPDGSLYVAVRDRFDGTNQPGAVIRYPRNAIR